MRRLGLRLSLGRLCGRLLGDVLRGRLPARFQDAVGALGGVFQLGDGFRRDFGRRRLGLFRDERLGERRQVRVGRRPRLVRALEPSQLARDERARDRPGLARGGEHHHAVHGVFPGGELQKLAQMLPQALALRRGLDVQVAEEQDRHAFHDVAHVALDAETEVRERDRLPGPRRFLGLGSALGDQGEPRRRVAHFIHERLRGPTVAERLEVPVHEVLGPVELVIGDRAARSEVHVKRQALAVVLREGAEAGKHVPVASQLIA
jgi:hypothetical protein